MGAPYSLLYPLTFSGNVESLLMLTTHLRLRLQWSQNWHNTTVWTDSRQGSRYQPHYCSC